MKSASPLTGWSATRISLALVLLLFSISAVVLISAYSGIRVQSWVRAYTVGEGIWSKAQKDAVIALMEYANTGEPAAFRRYEREIAVPMADRIARLEMERPRPDLDVAYEALARGRNDPGDIPGLATLFRRFRNVSYMDSAVTIWETGDSLIAMLDSVAQELRLEISAGRPAQARVDELTGEILRLNAVLSPLEDEFSQTLGRGARWMRGVLTLVMVGGGLLLIAIMTAGSWLLVRRVRRAEERLVRSERAFRSLIENATHGIYRATLEGKFLAVNPAFVSMLGYDSAEELLGVPVGQLYADPAERQRLIEKYGEEESAEGIEVEWKRKDGSPVIVRLSGRRFHDDEGVVAGFEMIVEDVTERHLLEEQLRQSQKMEAVGQLTGGIAHDLNNLLTAVLANADLLAIRMSPQVPDVRENLEDLRDATRRAAQMIRKLLAFSRREKLTLNPVDLGHVLRDAMQVLEHVLPKHIELQTEISTQLPVVHADAGAVEQMLVNLATNARDAMPGGGTLTIAISRNFLTPEFCLTHGWGRPGEYVRLLVKDTGVGMSDDVRRHLFEPFFTTKPPGFGTGLGMAMIYGLIKQHDGFVDVETRVGTGTTIYLYFPVLARRAEVPVPPEREDGAELPGGSETVLVVDDEEVIRRAAVRVLERLGYTTLTASDGAEGLRIMRRQGKEIDLVVMDVVMPKMSGPELYARLRQGGYVTPTLFMSGYTGGDRGVPGLDPSVPFLQKPWTVQEFAAVVRATIDAPRPLTAEA